jgi:iron complex transport system substrate-binding protein
MTVTDDTGSEVTLESPAETVVAGDAASAQTLWEVGAADRVVGMPVRPYTDYLEGAGERTDVLTEDGSQLSLETVVELDADLVVVPNYVSDASVQQLRDANQTVYRSPFESSFEDIYAKTELYGHFVGDCEAGASTAAETRSTVESIRNATADRERPDVLYYFFGQAAGNGTFIGDMVETAGGTNVAAEAGVEGYGEISDEVILEQNPEWIVTTDDEGAFDAEASPFPQTSAVQNDRVLRVDANLVSQAAPRVVEPLRAMAETFHPEAFETGTGSATATPDGTADATATEGDTGPRSPAADGESEDDGAGFGVAAAVCALLAAAFLARRR